MRDGIEPRPPDAAPGSHAATAGWSDERIAINDARFRDANERIRERAEELGLDERVPFLCECADPGCHEVIRITLDEYDEVRSEARLFFNAPGHAAAAQQAGHVVERRDGYAIVEKTGRAGEVADLTDPREAEAAE
jgi:hypothetical protein